MAFASIVLGILTVILLMFFYLLRVNQMMTATPPEVVKISPKRWTGAEIKEAYEKYSKHPTSVKTFLPPKCNRRYIVVGGSGLVGGWIVEHLLQRGEKPSAIRIVDVQQPRRTSIVESQIQYIKTDVTDQAAVSKAFNAPWAADISKLPLTVYHTVAYIKPYDRKTDFLAPYLKVNVQGTSNVLTAAKSAGCSVFIATSSGSVAVRRPYYLVAPWRKYPKNWFQVSENGEPENFEAPLEKFSGCYAYSKALAETLVTNADNKQSGFRTGAIRPGHAIYGHGDENPMSLSYDYLRRRGSPTWIQDLITQMVSAENVSLAHLLFEARLVSPSATLDVGGNAYAITDPSPPLSFGDLYTLLQTLSHPACPCNFPRVSPVSMLLVSYLVETYVLLQHRYLTFLPKVTSDLVNLQPAMLNVSTLHMLYNCSRAKQELGYDTSLGTMEGLCLQVKEWNERVEIALKGGKQPAGILKPVQRE